jgi:hypothetical protein
MYAVLHLDADSRGSLFLEADSILEAEYRQIRF